MKNAFALILIFWISSFSQLSHACSEAGPKEFRISKKLLEQVQKSSIEYAQAIAGAEDRLAKKDDDTFKPPYTKASATFTEALSSKKGLAPSFTLATSFTTASGWDCLYCV